MKLYHLLFAAGLLFGAIPFAGADADQASQGPAKGSGASQPSPAVPGGATGQSDDC